MYISEIKMLLNKKETYFHIAFWCFYFATINANWTDNWFDRSLRPETVSQFAIILFPIFLYLNAFWLIPVYLKKRKWIQYTIITSILIIGIEISRSLLYIIALPYEGSFESAFIAEYNSYDNIIFGRLNPIILCLQFSFAYRLTRDWFYHHKLIEKLRTSKIEQPQDSHSIPEDRTYKSSFSIKKRKKVIVLNTSDILYFQAQGDFVLAIDRNGSKHIINGTLSKIESEVDPNNFFKINRSEILNKDFVANYETHIKNRLKIALHPFEAILYTSNSRTPSFRKWVT